MTSIYHHVSDETILLRINGRLLSENIVSTPQSIDAGTTFHFMSDNMKKTLFSTLSNSIATTRQ